MTIGKADYERFKRGEQLTHRTAILAQCYVCNGMGEGGEDCKGKSCPLYQFMPYRADREKRAATPQQIESLRKANLTRKSPRKGDETGRDSTKADEQAQSVGEEKQWTRNS